MSSCEGCDKGLVRAMGVGGVGHWVDDAFVLCGRLEPDPNSREVLLAQARALLENGLIVADDLLELRKAARAALMLIMKALGDS